MIRSELVASVAQANPHLSHKDVERVVATVFDSIIDALAEGGRVELRGFGAFSGAAEAEARAGMTPGAEPRAPATVEVLPLEILCHDPCFAPLPGDIIGYYGWLLSLSLSEPGLC